VTNVGDDATIPLKEARHWIPPAQNTFRMNPIGSQDFSAPDLAAEARDVVAATAGTCPDAIALRIKVWNRGAILVAPGVPIAVYAGAPGGAPVAVARTAGAIQPGGSEVVEVRLSPAPVEAQDYSLVLNDDGTGEGVVGECDRANNLVALRGLRCPSQSF
jgi:hypothetical protein